MASRAKTVLIYSGSGGAKTSQCVFIAKYIWEKYGKRTRLISSDGGGWAPVEDEGLIWHPKNNPNGIVEVFNMTNRAKYLAEWRKLSTGQWPQVMMEGGQMVRRFVPTPANVMREIGCYFIEGLTSVGSGFISHISKQDNSKDSVTKVMYTAPGYEQDGEHFGATDQGHVGMVQNELNNLTQQFGTLNVELVVWTALVGEATEKSLKRLGLENNELGATLGPKLSGSAKTAEAPSWFSDCLHLYNIPVQETVDDSDGRNVKINRKKMYAFFEEHTDEGGNNYLCKCSIGPSMYPKLKKIFPGGFVELGFGEGIDKYLKVVDSLKTQIVLPEQQQQQVTPEVNSKENK